jgi:opacity protein-like surface antigen
VPQIRGWLLALPACLAFAAPGVAGAQPADDYARNGAYLGLAGSFGIYTKAEDELPGDADVEEPLGLNARAGYRMHPHLAAEGEFEWLSEADVEISGFDVGTIEAWTLTANGKAYPLTGRVQPFALIGLGAMLAEAEGGGGSEVESGFAARFGAGVDVYITRNFLAAFDVSYVLPTGDLEDFDYVSIGWGLGYRF